MDHSDRALAADTLRGCRSLDAMRDCVRLQKRLQIDALTGTQFRQRARQTEAARPLITRLSLTFSQQAEAATQFAPLDSILIDELHELMANTLACRLIWLWRACAFESGVAVLGLRPALAPVPGHAALIRTASSVESHVAKEIQSTP